ncbi:MAG: aminoglycoside phosphotransferase, partial [Acidimicrobiales bacterium]|nr:aminoglycoside phosphotransferase [Acidimicrobiales bacterium]
GPVVVRARAATAAGTAVAQREVAVARALIAADVPAVGLAGDDQPIATAGTVVTAWHWIPGAHGHPTPHQVGLLARRLRERTSPPPPDVPRFDPLGAVAEVLAGAPASPERDWLVQRAAELEEPWATAADDDPAGRAVVHGDLHRENVLVGPDGPLLSDLELSGWGPPSYDLAPAVVAVSRYGADPGELVDVLRAVGADPRPWSGWPTFVAVYELWVTAWAVAAGGRDPELAREGALRVATLREGSGPRWHLR